MRRYPSLVGRHVLVTGASRGLGRAMTLGLLTAGARVTLACTGESPALGDTRRQAAAAAPPSRWTVAFGDLREPRGCADVAAAAEAAFGPVDVLVNNAGIPNVGPGEPFWAITDDDWTRIARTNCDSVFFLSRQVAGGMLTRRAGKIVNISTSDRTFAKPRFVPYGPSKAFVEACSRAWAEELRGSGVTMNVLSPGGAVDTSADITGVPGPGKAYLTAAVMVPPLLWLAADESDTANGQRFVASRWDDALDLKACVAQARDTNEAAPRIM